MMPPDPTESPSPSSHHLSDQTQRRLIAIIESTTDLISMALPDGSLIYLNRAGRRLIGLGKNDLLAGRNVRDFLPPEAAGLIFGTALPAATRDGTWSGETSFCGPEGRCFPVSQVIIAHYDADRVSHFSIIVRDLSAQKQAERELRESHELLERVFDTTHFCLVYLDRDFNFIRVNRAYAEACGHPVDFFPGKNHFALYPQADNEAIFREVVRTGQPFTILAKPFRYPDHPEWGTTYWDWTLHPLKDATGQVEALLFVLLDVTKRKLAEETLRESEARYRLLFDDNPQPMWLYDAETLRFLAVNDAAVTHYGYTRGEFLGLTIHRLCPLGEPPTGEDLAAGVSHPCHSTGERRHARKDGSLLSVEVHSHPLNFAGHAAVLVIATDITEKKRLEEKFLRTQRLENLGLLAAGIAHDLNNVLSPVLMGSTLLRLRATTHPADLPILETLEKSATRGANLVRQILSFARGSGEGTVIQPKHLLRDIAELIEETFPKTIQLDAAIPKDLWTIHGNPTHFHQVLLNLCVNARDAMPKGGTLRLSATNRRFNEAAGGLPAGIHPGSYVVIEVGDTGTGMPPDVLERIWEPFFTTKGEKGTGLGLSTVRGIVHSHGGVITVDSAVGRGTTFRAYLPAAEAPGEEPPALAPALPAPTGRGELVLVVDDEAHIRNLVAALLSQQGYRTLVAANGTEALTFFTPRPDEFALVITDLRMPEFDGPALARVLPRFNPAVKILFMTGAASAREGDSLPPQMPLLDKPFTPAQLLTQVDRMLHPAPSAPA